MYKYAARYIIAQRWILFINVCFTWNITSFSCVSGLNNDLWYLFSFVQTTDTKCKLLNNQYHWINKTLHEGFRKSIHYVYFLTVPRYCWNTHLLFLWSTSSVLECIEFWSRPYIRATRRVPPTMINTQDYSLWTLTSASRCQCADTQASK